MTFILTSSGVVLTFTLLRLMGNEREHVQRRREGELALKAAEAAAAAAEAPAPEVPAAKPAAKGQATKGAVVPSKPASPVKPPAAKKAA